MVTLLVLMATVPLVPVVSIRVMVPGPLPVSSLPSTIRLVRPLSSATV